MVALKPLPRGNQTFAEIIDQDMVYSDKTKLIYNLITAAERNYFLSRPRRFGKTLLMSTLEELFTGESQRFQNLWIGQSDYAFPKVPVIRLSLSMDADSPQVVMMSLMAKLERIADLKQLKVPQGSFEERFGFLIKALYSQSKAKVAVLIEDSDAPVKKALDDEDLALANAKVIYRFLATLKDPKVAPYIHFTLVTGVTRYALNPRDTEGDQLVDISLLPQYSGLCGFTLEELDGLFADRLEETLEQLRKDGKMGPFATVKVLKENILKWYGGYNWGGETRVLNPHSLLYFFANKKFSDYWIQTGRPAYLKAMFRSLDCLEPSFATCFSSQIRNSDLTRPLAEPTLFHHGYLTLDQVIQVKPSDGTTETKRLHSFRFPNFEVSFALNKARYKVGNSPSKD
ncbi:MAG: AAA family ATPase [Deltaproteobacteria bacterium]|jgi:hypothetical protein|nr:AAA family ATPase [Deltaproteobacteria bacterium]